MPRTFISTLSASPKCLARCFSALSPATPLSNVLPFVAPGVACSASRERFGGVSFRRCLTLYVQGLAFPTASSGQSWGEATEAEVPESPPRSKMDDLSLNGPAQATPAPDMDPFVQYIVIRKDLVETLKWPLGSIISQGCHAAVAATWLHKDDVHTLQYCSPENLDNMHTVSILPASVSRTRNSSRGATYLNCNCHSLADVTLFQLGYIGSERQRAALGPF